jgi:nitrogen fixation protein NifX
MSEIPISDEIALRIGLAARELPDINAAGLLRVLDDAVGLPPTAKRLASLTVKTLKEVCDGELTDIDTAAVKSALACLKGEACMRTTPRPEVVPYHDGEMPNSIRVACASNQDEMLDGHFGSCKGFLIYQVSESEHRLIEIREIGDADAADDRNTYRASVIADCQILFVASIGGPAAAKVVRAGVHPIKRPRTGPASEEIEALQKVVGKGVAPWLGKVMGQTPEERIRFEQEVVGEGEAGA